MVGTVGKNIARRVGLRQHIIELPAVMNRGVNAGVNLHRLAGAKVHQ